MRISLIKPKMFGNEEKYVKDAFDSNWLAPLGPFVSQFENDICNYLNIDNAVAVCSGTAAIHLALKTLGIKKDDIVFCQDMTFIASANPILYENATPVFIDSERKTGCIDPDALRKAFKKYKAKAVIVVHLYGCIAEMDEIVKICHENNAYLIEDGTEALGSTYKGKNANTFGDVGCLSFNGNKIITTTGGGMLVTREKEIAEKAFSYATQSRLPGIYYAHNDIGYNYRLSNVSAAIGVGQLENIDKILKSKKYINDCYKKGFKHNPKIEVFDYDDDRYNNHWMSCIKLIDYDPQVLLKKLDEYDIETRLFWVPLHRQSILEQYDYIKVGDKSVSDELFDTCLCLPSDLNMSLDDICYVIQCINSEVK